MASTIAFVTATEDYHAKVPQPVLSAQGLKMGETTSPWATSRKGTETWTSLYTPPPRQWLCKFAGDRKIPRYVGLGDLEIKQYLACSVSCWRWGCKPLDKYGRNPAASLDQGTCRHLPALLRSMAASEQTRDHLILITALSSGRNFYFILNLKTIPFPAMHFYVYNWHLHKRMEPLSDSSKAWRLPAVRT